MKELIGIALVIAIVFAPSSAAFGSRTRQTVPQKAKVMQAKDKSGKKSAQIKKKAVQPKKKTIKPAPQEAVEQTFVTYTDRGFSPESVTVKVGAKVKFVNQSSEGMWVASAIHPTHQTYPEFDQLSTRSEYTFEFTKVGSWKYHNHVNPSKFGTVIVE